MKQLRIHIAIIAALIFANNSYLNAQGYLHADKTNIVDGNGENFILRGIGTGNWMLMEGYMMQTAGTAGTQHEFRAKLEETIGIAKTDSFFNTWLANHFTRTDVDSMKAWGFNSVRAALHYKWFTPPIEDEPVAGEITWLNKGFVMVDSLLQWCADNEMYLILDMHGTPGGQGKNADISDYDHTKPSLWESVENQDKLTALWYKLAERYANEKWIGGYDLINETNWDFENSGNENGVNCVHNTPLHKMHKRLIDTVRTIDNNHLVFVSGNSWGNNYSGMNSLASHDDNLAYTFHKYWNTNNDNDVDWITAMRDELNVPLWMSESGENSNTWYTDAISLFENNNIGWSWWPVKKNSINNVLSVEINEDYEDLIKYWKGETSAPTEDEAFQAVLTWANNHKIENCAVQYDVIDAMIRQPKTDETIPYTHLSLNEPIHFSNFDLGKNGIAYFDNDAAYYGGAWTGWNNGWEVRSDGVDIEKCTDTESSNGYNVGWTEDGEWMQYSLNSDSTAAYQLNIRHASGAGGSKVHLEVNGVDVTGKIALPGTGGWQNWETATFENIILPTGNINIKFILDQGGSNLSYFSFTNPISINDVPFEFISAKTSVDGKTIYVDLNKEITTSNDDFDLTEFTLNTDLTPVTINSVSKQVSPSTVLIIEHDEKLYSDQEITLSYNGTSVKANNQELVTFENELVTNNLPLSHTIPGKIQTEDFVVNNGFSFETCEDNGDGTNTSYANAGDYLEYMTHVTKDSYYKINYRVATERSNAELILQIENESGFVNVDTIKFTSTGGWQKWETQNSVAYLNAGYYNIRILVKQGEHNLNWFSFTETTVGINENANNDFNLFPNPANEELNIWFGNADNNAKIIKIYNLSGQIVYETNSTSNKIQINTTTLSKGVYFVKVNNTTQKLIVK